MSPRLLLQQLWARSLVYFACVRTDAGNFCLAIKHKNVLWSSTWKELVWILVEANVRAPNTSAWCVEVDWLNRLKGNERRSKKTMILNIEFDVWQMDKCIPVTWWRLTRWRVSAFREPKPHFHPRRTKKKNSIHLFPPPPDFLNVWLSSHKFKSHMYPFTNMICLRHEKRPWDIFK